MFLQQSNEKHLKNTKKYKQLWKNYKNLQKTIQTIKLEILNRGGRRPGRRPPLPISSFIVFIFFVGFYSFPIVFLVF